MNKLNKEIKKIIKKGIVDTLIASGITVILKLFWDELEILFDGGVQVSISDTVIAVILINILWQHVRKWIEIKSEVEQ